MFGGLAGAITGHNLRMQEYYKSILPFLDRYKAPPAGAAVPARDLTQAQARDLVIHHFHNQHLVLEKWPEFDTHGNPTYPKIGEKVRLTYKIADVDFVANQPVARSWDLTKPIDQRLAVLLVRVAQWLKTNWNTSIVYWGGIGVGRDPKDRHGQGFALDFHGAVTQAGEFNVYRDWGAVRVPKSIGGDVHGKWPATARRTSYRLDVDLGEFNNLLTASLSADFFKDFYNFLTTQATHGVNNGKAPLIGEWSSVLHPDTPNPALRPGHQNHIHVEIDR